MQVAFLTPVCYLTDIESLLYHKNKQLPPPHSLSPSEKSNLPDVNSNANEILNKNTYLSLQKRKKDSSPETLGSFRQCLSLNIDSIFEFS